MDIAWSLVFFLYVCGVAVAIDETKNYAKIGERVVDIIFWPLGVVGNTLIELFSKLVGYRK